MQNTSMMLWPLLFGTLFSQASAQSLPEQAQLVDQKSLNVLDTVEPVYVENLTTVGSAGEQVKRTRSN
jgi:hypothetical protein